MKTALTHEILTDLRHLLKQDSQQPVPVVKAVSLEFYEHLKRWVQHIAVTPEPFTIALAGGSGSGKSMVRSLLVDALSDVAEVSAFTQDNYYCDFSACYPHWTLEEFYHRIDFDDPAHIQFQQLLADLRRLKTLHFGQILHIPRLVYGTPDAKPTIVPAGLAVPVTPFIVTEGIHAFHSAELRALYDFRIYVDVDEDTRRERWLARNYRENRGVTDNMWQTTVACLEQHILPNRSRADLVINNAAPREQIEAFIRQVIHRITMAARRAA